LNGQEVSITIANSENEDSTFLFIEGLEVPCQSTSDSWVERGLGFVGRRMQLGQSWGVKLGTVSKKSKVYKISKQRSWL
jgi:hypothetical protein